MKKLLAGLVVMCWAGSALGEDVSQIVARLQTSYESIQTVQAAFHHTYRSKRFDAQEASGHVWIRTPGRMRWDYDKPKGKVMVMDGKQITLYDPLDRQALVGAQPKDEDLPVAFSFLWGKGKLKETFQISLHERKVSSEGEEFVLKCVPKREMPNVSEIYFTVRMGTPVLVTATRVRDGFGGESEIRFSGIRTNEKLSDDKFAYRPPKDTPVVSLDSKSLKF